MLLLLLAYTTHSYYMLYMVTYYIYNIAL